MNMDEYGKISYKDRPVYSSDTYEELRKEAEILDVFEAERKVNEDNPYSPIYHFTRPANRPLNDPNGLCYFKGYWHMFYQSFYYDNGERTIHWGHTISEDLIHWKDMPDAHFVNAPETGCWSGAVCVVGDKAYSMHYGQGENWDYGLVFSVSEDPLLVNWTRLNEEGPCVKADSRINEGHPYKVYDPFVWYEDGVFYALSGRNDILSNDKYVRQAFLFSSVDGKEWKYEHPFIKNDYAGELFDDAGCPYFYQLEDDKYIMIHFCHHLHTPKYAIGTYDKEKKEFTILSGDRMFSPRAVVAPSLFPVGEKKFACIFNANGIKTSMMTLPRTLWEKNGELFGAPYETIKSLRYNERAKAGFELGDNEIFEDAFFKGRECELEIKYQAYRLPVLEIQVLASDNNEEHTDIYVYTEGGIAKYMTKDVGWKKWQAVLMGNTIRSSVKDTNAVVSDKTELAIDEGEEATVRVYIDRSVVEVFLNDKRSIVLHVAPDVTSDKIRIIPHGGALKINSIKLWDMKKSI